MSKKNKDPNRTGFFRYLDVIRRVERDKDKACDAMRIPRGGADVFGNLDRVVLDLNRRRDKGCLMGSDYFGALDRIQRMIDAQNAHEIRMAEIAAGIHKACDES